MPRFSIGALLLLLLSCNANPVSEQARERALTVHHNEDASLAAPGEILRVATLNIAHGRGQSLNQLLVSGKGIARNLADISHFLRDRDIHIAALQEVDSPSAWSGQVDQAKALARTAGYPWWAQASHASLGVARYGTAILSTAPMLAAASVDFPPSPPTAGKGFTLAQVHWNPGAGKAVTVDIISIHMDFSRKSVREEQLEVLARVMEMRRQPLILMGDFNSETLAKRLMAGAADDERQLHTWNDSESAHASYKDKRLDWIIVSGDIEFISYTTANDPLSDHRAVIAELRLAPE